MTPLNHQLVYALVFFFLNLLGQEIKAEMAPAPETPISNLYENLLQREYADPVVFPNHQVERKALRSPSLRLRFGRSAPDMLNSVMEKRWFGDVHQKPIRSPSLRLRFGRRSDPNVPRRTSFDDLLERELSLNGDVGTEDSMDDYNDAAALNDAYERVVRKPQRLRWGRSGPQYETPVATEEDIDRYNGLINAYKLRNMLLALRQYDFAHQPENMVFDDEDTVNIENTNEFQREVRKPGPLRLRWGRSTGGVSTEKKEPPQTEQSVEKTQN